MKAKIFGNYSLTISTLVLGVMVISMGSFTFDLGFYLDDWPNIFFQQIKGADATRLFHAYDGRPLQGWYQISLFQIFSTKAWLWQIYNFLLRYLTVIVTWLVFIRLWPESKLKLGLVAILFAVYPIFAQQPMAITFMVHWTSFLCVMLSILLMLTAIDQPKLYFLLTGIALGLSGLGLILIEYFIGLELIRPFLLWIIFKKKESTHTSTFQRTVLYSLPYYVLILAFVIWRAFLIDLPVPDRNQLVLLENFMDAPLRTILKFSLMVGQDFITTFIASWYKTLSPNLLHIDGPISILALGIALGLFMFIGFFFKSWMTNAEKQGRNERSEWLDQICVGLLVVILGTIPGWLVDRQVSDISGLWSDRFGMAGMAGASLVLIVLLERIISDRNLWVFIIAGSIGLAGAWQFRNSNDYRWSWEYQQRVFNQLTWRIPAVKPDTLFLSTYEFFSKMGAYPTAFAINSIYPQSRSNNQVDYWFQVTPKFLENWDEYLGGAEFMGEHWQAYFKGNTNNAILLDYGQSEMHCLWVLSPEDSKNPFLDIYTRASLQNSDLSRILLTENENPNDGTIVPRAKVDWCYFFQKADLAQQFSDWSEIADLWQDAQLHLDTMNSGVELIPFIDGFVHLEEYALASDLSKRAAFYGYDMRPYLCDTWAQGLEGKQPEENHLKIITAVSSDLGCDWE